jgi:hypothetical protein
VSKALNQGAVPGGRGIPTHAEIVEACAHLANRDVPLPGTPPDPHGFGKQLHSELQRGRLPRAVCHSRRKGKTFTTPSTYQDRVCNRVVERRIRSLVVPRLPPEHFGLVAGTSVQKATECLARWLEECGPDDHVVRLDVAGCFEGIDRGRALAQVEALGVDAWTMRYIRAVYRRSRPIVRGLGRGLAFAPLIAAHYLLPVYEAVRAHSARVIWVGDDFLVLVDDGNAATAVLNAALAAILALGLRPSAGKTYARPVTDTWTFAGLVHKGQRTSPRQKALARVRDKVTKAKSVASASGVVAGWAGYYRGITLPNPEISRLSYDLADAHHGDLPDITKLLAAPRARRRAPQPDLLEVRESAFGPARSRGSGSVASLRENGECPTLWAADMPLCIEAALPRGPWRVSGHEGRAILELLAQWAHREALRRGLLSDPDDPDADYLCTGHERIGQHLPEDVFDALSKFDLRKRWASVQAMWMVGLYFDGLVDARAIKDAVRWSLERARRVHASTRRDREYRRRHRWLAWWVIRAIDGRLFVDGSSNPS